MSRRNEIYLLVGLLVLLVASLYFMNRGQTESTGVLAADAKFQPLDVEEPRLRIDLLAKLQKLEYSGAHKDIFVAAPLAPVQLPGGAGPLQASKPFVGPQVPPPPPPLQVPAEFFGYATRPKSGKRVGFFTSGDDVLVVGEGETFLGRYRLSRIGNDSADIEEVSTGRRTTMPIVQPPSDQAGAQ